MAIHLFARKALRGETIPRFGGGLSRRDYTYVGDIVRGLLAALDRPTAWRVVNLGSNDPISLNGLLTKIGEAFEVPMRIEQLPEQPGDVPSTWADTDRAAQELDWRARVSLDEGLQHFRRWMTD